MPPTRTDPMFPDDLHEIAHGGATQLPDAPVCLAAVAAGQLTHVELRAAPDDARATTVHFTARGRRLLATVFELVEEIERDFAAVLEPGAYDALREDLLRIADRIDPGGALGAGDAP